MPFGLQHNTFARTEVSDTGEIVLSGEDCVQVSHRGQQDVLRSFFAADIQLLGGTETSHGVKEKIIIWNFNPLYLCGSHRKADGNSTGERIE